MYYHLTPTGLVSILYLACPTPFGTPLYDAIIIVSTAAKFSIQLENENQIELAKCAPSVRPSLPPGGPEAVLGVAPGHCVGKEVGGDSTAGMVCGKRKSSKVKLKI